MEGAVAVPRDHPLSPARERARANNISEALSAILPDSGVRNKSIKKCFLVKNGIGPKNSVSGGSREKELSLFTWLVECQDVSSFVDAGDRVPSLKML